MVIDVFDFQTLKFFKIIGLNWTEKDKSSVPLKLYSKTLQSRIEESST